MATIVLTDPFISLAGVDQSDHFTSLSLEFTADMQEKTAFGSEWREKEGGLKDVSLSLDFNQDFDDGEIDSALWLLFGTSVAIVIRPNSDAVSANNPQYSGDAMLESYPPLGNSVGELATGSITLPGNGEWTRATS